MLRITIPATELWDEVHEEFIRTKEQTLQLEHSLVSISKWESRWQKAFLGKQKKTDSGLTALLSGWKPRTAPSRSSVFRYIRQNGSPPKASEEKWIFF